MAALLDIVHLRRHALSVNFLARDMGGIARLIDPPAHPQRRQAVEPRRRLLAVWRIGASGRPECSWAVDPSVTRQIP